MTDRIIPACFAVVIAFLAAACSASAATPTATAPVTTSTIGSTTTTPAPDPDRTDVRPAAPTTTSPTTTTTILTVESLPHGSSLVGHASTPVDIYPGQRVVAPSQMIEAVTILGSPRVFLVETGPVDGWVLVSLPTRPNGSTGWMRADALDLRVLDLAISVDLSDRVLRLEKDRQVILETEVAVGSPRNPTPTGGFFVTDVIELADPSGPWGPFALGISAHSDSITEFNGGDGIIGIHGTNRPASIGDPVSLGCVRVPNEVAVQLAEIVALGTPVEIVE